MTTEALRSSPSIYDPKIGLSARERIDPIADRFNLNHLISVRAKLDMITDSRPLDPPRKQFEVHGRSLEAGDTQLA
jgi:hypothetical protein